MRIEFNEELFKKKAKQNVGMVIMHKKTDKKTIKKININEINMDNLIDYEDKLFSEIISILIRENYYNITNSSKLCVVQRSSGLFDE